MKGREAVVLVAVGVLLGAVLLAGCGGDSGTSAAATNESSGPLTKEQFVKQATAICIGGLKEKDKNAIPELEKLAAETRGEPDPKTVGKIVEETVLPPYRLLVERLAQLQAPKGEAGRVKKVVEAFEAGLEQAEAEPEKAAVKNPFADANEAARDYGLEFCRL